MVQAVLPLRPEDTTDLVGLQVSGRVREMLCGVYEKLQYEGPRILKQSHPIRSEKLDIFPKNKQNKQTITIATTTTKKTALSIKAALSMLRGLGRNGMPDYRAIVTLLSGLPTMNWPLSSCNSGSCGSSYFLLQSIHPRREAHQNPENAISRTYTRQIDLSGTRIGLQLGFTD